MSSRPTLHERLDERLDRLEVIEQQMREVVANQNRLTEYLCEILEEVIRRGDEAERRREREAAKRKPRRGLHVVTDEEVRI